MCIKIRIYVRHKAEAQLQIGALREPQDLGERAAGCRPLVYIFPYFEFVTPFYVVSSMIFGGIELN